MTQYEYKIVNTSSGEWLAPFRGPVTSDVSTMMRLSTVPDMAAAVQMQLDKHLNALGAEGWRFCGSVAPFLFFVREKVGEETRG